METKKSGCSFFLVLILLIGLLIVSCACCAVSYFAYSRYSSDKSLGQNSESLIEMNDLINKNNYSTRIPSQNDNFEDTFKAEQPTSTPEPKLPSSLEGIDFNNLEFPIIVDSNAQHDYSTVETVYQFYVNRLFNAFGDDVQISSPVITDKKVEISFKVFGDTHTTWIVEQEVFPDASVTVVAGPPNAGAEEIYYLQSTGAVWAIFAIEEVSF